MRHSNRTSWQPASKWYNQLVGPKGHYYHQHVILPQLTRILNLKPGDSLLDLACGQGVLSRQLPKGVNYTGVDISPNLIASANKQSLPGQKFITADITKPIPKLTKQAFSHATIILALQNLEHPLGAIKNASHYLQPHGKLVIVINHPHFRIPRQSGWDINPQTKLQYRWVNRYMSPLKIPITTHPGHKKSSVTWSFHQPLTNYVTMLKRANFVVTDVQEWASDKESQGSAAKMENRARSEIPMFMCLVCQLNTKLNN